MTSHYSRRHIRAAWAVHALTGTGVIVGYARLNAVVAGDARASILWLVAALVVDGVDGPIARRLEVSARIPTLECEPDGESRGEDQRVVGT